MGRAEHRANASAALRRRGAAAHPAMVAAARMEVDEAEAIPPAERTAHIDGLEVADLGTVDAHTQPGELDALFDLPTDAGSAPAVGMGLMQDVVLDHAVGHRRAAVPGQPAPDHVQAQGLTEVRAEVRADVVTFAPPDGRHGPLPRPAPAVVRLFDRSLEEHRRTFEAVAGLRGAVERTALALADCLRAGGKVLFCGNGGSAALSQQLAAQLTGRFLRERAPLAAMALPADGPALGGVGHELGLEQVFQRQVQALGRPGDVLVAVCTSGHAPNVLRAVRAARAGGLVTVALAGRDGGELARLCDDAVVVPSASPARVQEAHLFIGHSWCGLIEAHLGIAE